MHYTYSLAIYAHSVYNDSLIHAIEHGTDAASSWILEELEEGNDIPAPSNQKDIALEDDSFISLLVLDMNSYSEKYRSKTVRKNITIPAWLNTYGETHNVNFSKVLQDSLLALAQK